MLIRNPNLPLLLRRTGWTGAFPGFCYASLRNFPMYRLLLPAFLFDLVHIESESVSL
jgi:hypothetical protein